jgi:chorismate-pyruvate lyase
MAPPPAIEVFGRKETAMEILPWAVGTFIVCSWVEDVISTKRLVSREELLRAAGSAILTFSPMKEFFSRSGR